jgi:PKD repeat protein
MGIVAPLLALLVLAGPTLRLTSQSALAQTPVSPQILLCGGNGNQVWIVQDCHLRAAGMEAWEAEAIDGLLQAHELPSADRHLIVAWERNAVRSALFSRLVEAIMKAPAQRTTAEQQIINMLATRVQANRIAAAQYSVNEYNRWYNNQCGYVAPAGFSYQIDLSACNNLIGGLFDTPAPPTLQEFLNYGSAHVYADFKNDAALRNAAAEMAKVYGLLGGLGALVVGISIGAAIGASLTVSSALAVAIHPFLAAAVAGTNTAAATAAVAGASAAFATVGSFVGLAAMVVIAIVIGVLQGISVFTEAAIPGQLNDNLATAQTVPDLQQVVATDAGKREIMSVFLRATMPEHGSSSAVPTQQASDMEFDLTDLSGNRSISHTLGYQCWNPTHCADSVNHTARLNTGWFVDRNNAGAERLTLGIDYIDWDGKAWSAWRVGNQFLHSRTGDTSEPFLSDEIRFKAWDGTKMSAELYTPLTAAITSANPAESAPVSFAISGSRAEGDGLTYTWDFGDGTTPVVSSATTATHTYVDDGNYTVTITASGDLATAIPSLNVAVANVAPVLTYSGAPQTSPEGTTISVSGSASDPGVEDTFSLAWSVTKFGSPTEFASGSGETFSFTPDDGGDFGSFYVSHVDDIITVLVFGNYVVSLTATDDDGGVSVARTVMTVTNVAPTPTIDDAPATSVEGTEITLSGSYADPGTADTVSLGWTVTKDTAPFATGSGPTISFTPDDEGEYAATLTATDDDGGVASTTAQIAVSNANPVISIDAIKNDAGRVVNADDIVQVGLTVNVDESYSDAGSLDTRTASRDWGDGTIDSVGTVTDATTGQHIYSTPGTYTIRVTVNDNDGGISEATRQIVVVTPIDGVQSVIDDLRMFRSNSRTAKAAIDSALVNLEGNNGGKANNGAVDQLAIGNINAGLIKLRSALQDLHKASTADRSLDLTGIREQLTLTAKAVVTQTIADAQAAAEADGTVSKSEFLYLQGAAAAMTIADKRLEYGDYTGAVDTYRTALAFALKVLG